ncbi:TPA: hypothetical protein N0F65_000368 [Lagenidium giganteum]|uniref:WLM domain family protein n=1 Tax=Lagenidium giganteum TaxID=4803 RepID=A0AAV2Z2U7_9STRA|nr:TPA: hypothetical protein N0F65_000368 [Lagenidium giganteum]
MTHQIAQIKALVRQPQREQAQALLERIANAVLPILVQRRFRVRRLHEFFPKDARLLGMNVNRGATIYIRCTCVYADNPAVRPARSPTSFLPYEALLETMLHELTHMVHGPHNSAFYRYLDQLKEEMESLLMRGLVGVEGAMFAGAGAGQVLGGDGTITARFPGDNRAAVLAAQRRQQSARRLGNGSAEADGTAALCSREELRRRMLRAAEQRRQDNVACSNVDSVTTILEVLGVDEDDENEFTDVESAPPSSHLKPTMIELLDDGAPTDEEWECCRCTYLNTFLIVACAICGSKRNSTATEDVISLVEGDQQASDNPQGSGPIQKECFKGDTIDLTDD